MKKEISKPAYLREIHIRFKKKRVKNGSPVGQPVEGSKQIYEFFKDLQNEAKEKLIAIALDSKLKIICFEVVAIGALETLSFRAAETLRVAIAMNAYGTILVHNHPSGDFSPSPHDKKFTKKLTRNCQDLGIVLWDHVIIGNEGYFSFMDSGLIDEFIDEIKENE